MPIREELFEIYKTLQGFHQSAEGWPGGAWPLSGEFDPPQFEVVVGALLTQNTNWRNVERTLSSLRQRRLVSPGALAACEEVTLQQVIRPCGFFRQKARRLLDLSRFILAFPGDFFRQVSREQLLQLEGVGPETADSILLFACGRPHFVVDAYTRRILQRYGLLQGGEEYSEVQALFEDHLPHDVKLYQRFHAFLVEHAKGLCRTRPLCGDCPLLRRCHWGRRQVQAEGSPSQSPLSG